MIPKHFEFTLETYADTGPNDPEETHQLAIVPSKFVVRLHVSAKSANNFISIPVCLSVVDCEKLSRAFAIAAEAARNDWTGCRRSGERDRREA